MKKLARLAIASISLLSLSFSTYLDARNRHKKRAHAFQKKMSNRITCPDFARTLSRYFDAREYNDQKTNYLMWESPTPIHFDELILSWNARRPPEGTMTFLVSVKHTTWSPWHRLAEWGPDFQQTFVNKLNPYVHTKHVRVELQKHHLGQAFRVKVVFNGGVQKSNLHALFVCISRSKHYRRFLPKTSRPSVVIQGIPRQSQMVLDHPRYKQLCSPTAMSMMVKYFAHKFYKVVHNKDLHIYATNFADMVHDDGYLDIYGNWPLNIAQAYEANHGDVFYRVERLNCFDDLYTYLSRKIPVAVSVRHLKGGATPYAGGHFMVVIGWNQEKQSVICIDPAFYNNKATLKTYKIGNFLRAWGLSRNLAYIPIPKKEM